MERKKAKKGGIHDTILWRAMAGNKARTGKGLAEIT